MDAPYKLRPWEIARLTDRQIVDLYYRKRDKEGNPLPFPKEEVAASSTPKPLTDLELEIEMEKARLNWWQVQFDLKRPEEETKAKWEENKDKVRERILKKHGMVKG